ncbi:MAG: hypothetical protein ACXVAX_07755 [Pseudobdellovibrio sp.]
MKTLIFTSLFFIGSISFGSSAKPTDGDLLNYSSVVDLNSYKGETYFALMTDVVKPALDQYATQGFIVADGQTVLAALKNVDPSVAQKAIRAAGNIDQLSQVADALHATGEKITFYNLPDALAKQGVGGGRYDLSTFLSLVSGGGVVLKMGAHSFAYNVNYGTGQTDKDEMTGRSFGETTNSFALDASDKHYLQILEKYVRSEGENSAYFYKSLLQILTNNDTSNFDNISAQGQAVASDFVAVYTAEQDRHLMAQLKSHPWDSALLEVTLISAFHGGQKNVMVMYNNELTEKTLPQSPGCSPKGTNQQPASMTDYWQYSTSTDPANCNRSGINVTRKDFRTLGLLISNYERQNHADLVNKIESHFTGSKGVNVFAELSDFLINYNTAKKLDASSLELAQDFTQFLMQVRQDANLISSHIVANNNK